MDILKEPMSMIPLADGGLAYMDFNGTVLMYELPSGLTDHSSLEEDGGLPTDSVLCSADEATLGEQTSLDQFVLPGAFQSQEAEVQDQEFDIATVENGAEDEDEMVDVEALDQWATGVNNAGGPEDCVEQVTMFKCRACAFTAPEKSMIINHFSEDHLGSMPLQTEVEVSPEPAEQESETAAADVNEEPVEHLLYLCSKCNGAFVSIELCRQHMIQEHKCISGKGKTVEKSNGVASTETNGQQAEWQNAAQPIQPTSADQTAQLTTNPTAERKENELELKKGALAVKERERKIKCTVRGCAFKFSNKECLEIHRSCHVKGHTSAREFQCLHCQEKFDRWRQCSSHLWRTHQVDVDMLACPVCLAYKASTSVKLQIHMRIHGDERPYRCSRCSKSFKQAAQLRNHTAIHMDKKAVDPVDMVPRWYMEQRCTLCDKTYSDAKCLKQHIKAVHSKLRPYVCTVCGHAAACRAMLVLHLRQHTGEKPHACPHCPYRTGDHNCLRRHLMRHTGERQYRCPHCPYTAIQTSSFKQHLRNRHPGQTGVFSCDKCRFQTIRAEAFQQHQSDHKKGLIPVNKAEDEEEDKEEYFPGNVAAAHFMFHYLGSVLKEPGQRPIHCANVMDTNTSPDGTTQSITIQIPTQERSSPDLENDESTNCFLDLKGTDEEISIDTGGITIPAEPTSADMT